MSTDIFRCNQIIFVNNFHDGGAGSSQQTWNIETCTHTQPQRQHTCTHRCTNIFILDETFNKQNKQMELERRCHFRVLFWTVRAKMGYMFLSQRLIKMQVQDGKWWWWWCVTKMAEHKKEANLEAVKVRLDGDDRRYKRQIETKNL